MRKFIQRIPPETRRTRIPELAVEMASGAVAVFENGYPVIETLNGLRIQLDIRDFQKILSLSKSVAVSGYDGIENALIAYSQAAKAYAESNEWVPERSVAMVSAGGGCGAWRMEFPAFAIADSSSLISIVSRETSWLNIEKYDVIRVQWISDWVSVQKLRSLAMQGKRIVVDLDDDLLNIPEHNPASRALRDFQKAAILETLSFCHCITVSTERIRDIVHEALCSINPLFKSKDIMVIPNAMDVAGMSSPSFEGSDDGLKRIFWSGSRTHSRDWEVLAGAIDTIFRKRKDVVLQIWGDIPGCILENYGESPVWEGRVENIPWIDSGQFFDNLASLNADIGVCPLEDNDFNLAKSDIKIIEMAYAGLPVVASPVGAYKEFMQDGENGFTASTEEEWVDRITRLLDDPSLGMMLASNLQDKVRREKSIFMQKDAWMKAIWG